MLRECSLSIQLPHLNFLEGNPPLTLSQTNSTSELTGVQRHQLSRWRVHCNTDKLQQAYLQVSRRKALTKGQQSTDSILAGKFTEKAKTSLGRVGAAFKESHM
jgi:hypothetical protein